jgi:FAD/FMN-containing dehydrogenase
MTSGVSEDARLFGQFVDPVDMIGCFPASMSLGGINAAVGEHGLRFPLLIDPDRTLPEHLDVTEFAPASARFGPYVDNVLGMNWELPSGRVVRIGERVVKSTTGYDLQRFLLHAGDRYGRPTDFILRLRPVGGASLAGRFAGDGKQLERIAHALRRSSWSHWIDCIDTIMTEDSAEALHVRLDCRAGEESMFAAYFRRLAGEAGAEFLPETNSPSCRLPLFSIKCLPSASLGIARRCLAQTGGEARVLHLNGAVLLRPSRPPSLDWLEALGRELEEQGGHVSEKLHHNREARESEAPWISVLEERWAAL